MPRLQPDELRNRVSQFIAAIGWNSQTSTADAAKDFYIILDETVSFIVEECMSGGGKGPGPLPHRPNPPPTPGGGVSRLEDYLTKMSGLLIHFANNSSS